MNTGQVLYGALCAIFLAMLGGCGSGSGGDSRNFNTLGGSISMNLVNAPAGAATGLQLYDGVETYDVTLPAQTTGSVPFGFPTALSQGTAYAITVVNSPAGLSCTPSANATGTMGTAPITNVTVICTDSAFTITGTVQLNLVNALPSNVELAISDGSDVTSVQLPAGATTATLPAFSFPTALKTGTQYRISVPDNPTDLTCTVSKASGTITSSDVKNVLVTCSDSAFYLSGQATVSLQQPYTSNTATVLLTDGTDLTYPVNISIGSGALTASQSFIFPSLVAQGATYTLSVTANPAGNPIGLTCTPSNNQGTANNANITNIAINCSDAAYTLGGTVTGLQIAGGVQLSDGIDPPMLIGVGSAAFSFLTPLAYDSQYAVQILGQALVQCTLANATGAVLGPVVDLSLQCSLPELALLAGSGAPQSDNPLIGQGATFGALGGMAVDSSGNMYVADYGNNEIRKITPTGVVTTLAGSPAGGSADGTGSAATFEGPIGVAVDTVGNVYVADLSNYEIRKITPTGVVTTLAGSPFPGSADSRGSAASFDFPTGVAVDASGNVYVADSNNNEIRKITPAGVVTTLAGSTTAGSADGKGSAASFDIPAGVAVDASGNVYVADSGNSKIRKITPAGVVTTLAGSTTAGSADGTGSAASFNDPYGVAVDASGNIYVADEINNEIRRITPAGVVTTLAGSTTAGSADGTGSAASFNGPAGVAVDASGNIYVADGGNNEIRKITSTGVVTTLAGSSPVPGSANGTGSAASFNGPAGVAVDASGNVYVADSNNNEIRKITPAGAVTTLAGSTTPGSADGTGSAASFNGPAGVAVDASGNVYVADSGNNEIRKITPAGVVTTLFGAAQLGVSQPPELIAAPEGIAVDASGNVYVSEIVPAVGFQEIYQVLKITPAGVVTFLTGFLAGNLSGVAVDTAGNVYVTDSYDFEIRKITPAGVVTILAGSGVSGSADGTGSAASFNSPAGVAVDASGNVYVADEFNNEIRKITPAGSVTTIVGNYNVENFFAGSLPGSLGRPVSVALSPPDQFGNWNMVISTGQNLIAEIAYASAAFY